MEKNKTRKYFKYAIGEIILVVIGILIALSINNWNETRKTKRIEQALLADLKVEVEANMASLETTMESHQKSVEAAIEIRDIIFNPEKLSKVTDSIVWSLIYSMDTNWTYDPQLGTLNSIINSGKIDHISNKELRYKLSSLKDQIDDTNESTNTIEKSRPLFYYPIAAKSFLEYQSNEGWKVKVKEMFKDNEFAWFIGYYIAIRNQGKAEETVLLDNLNAMIRLIDSEIEQ